jgi:hypothetical protein
VKQPEVPFNLVPVLAVRPLQHRRILLEQDLPSEPMRGDENPVAVTATVKFETE